MKCKDFQPLWTYRDMIQRERLREDSWCEITMVFSLPGLPIVKHIINIDYDHHFAKLYQKSTALTDAKYTISDFNRTGMAVLQN